MVANAVATLHDGEIMEGRPCVAREALQRYPSHATVGVVLGT
jgi:hypothetical protein